MEENPPWLLYGTNLEEVAVAFRHEGPTNGRKKWKDNREIPFNMFIHFGKDKEIKVVVTGCSGSDQKMSRFFRTFPLKSLISGLQRWAYISNLSGDLIRFRGSEFRLPVVVVFQTALRCYLIRPAAGPSRLSVYVFKTENVAVNLKRFTLAWQDREAKVFLGNMLILEPAILLVWDRSYLSWPWSQ